MRDMIQRGDRSIRNIPVPNGHRQTASRPPGPPRGYDDEYAVDEEDDDMPPPRGPKVPRRRSKRIWFVLIGVVIACAVLGFAIATIFEGAVISITPKTEEVTTPQTLVAQPNA